MAVRHILDTGRLKHLWQERCNKMWTNEGVINDELVDKVFRLILKRRKSTTNRIYDSIALGKYPCADIADALVYLRGLGCIVCTNGTWWMRDPVPYQKLRVKFLGETNKINSA